jgi:hypothetical protein
VQQYRAPSVQKPPKSVLYVWLESDQPMAPETVDPALRQSEIVKSRVNANYFAFLIITFAVSLHSNRLLSYATVSDTALSRPIQATCAWAYAVIQSITDAVYQIRFIALNVQLNVNRRPRPFRRERLKVQRKCTCR